MRSSSLLNKANLNRAVAEKCLKLYPDVRDAVYIETRPRLNLKELIEDDAWRYGELPNTTRSHEGLSKVQLARLVKWKM